MKYLVTLVLSDIEDSCRLFCSLQDAVDYVRSYYVNGSGLADSVRIYELRSCLTCKFLDNKILIS